MGEETNKRKHGNPAGAVLLCGVMLFVVYILSPVPIAFAINHFGRPRQFPPVLNKIYRPIGWAQDHTFLRKPIEKYGRFLSGV